MSRLARLSLGLLLCIDAVLPAAPVPETPKVPRELLEQRLKAAEKTYKMKYTRLMEFRPSQVAPSELSEWSRRWLEAEKALSNKKEDHLKALQGHWKRMKGVEGLMAFFAKTGQGFQADAEAATYFCIEAEIWILEAGGKVPKLDEPPPKEHPKQPAREK